MDTLDSLAYYSQFVSIITKWDGEYIYTIEVYNEKTKKVVETVEVDTYWQFYSKPYDLFSEDFDIDDPDPLDIVTRNFEMVKTKYIFDYDNVLNLCTCNKRCVDCFRQTNK